MTSKLEQAARQTLTTLDLISSHKTYTLDLVRMRADALRTALAEHSAPVASEPIAWVIEGTEVDADGNLLWPRDIDYMNRDIANLPIGTKLYTAPQPAPVAVPDPARIKELVRRITGHPAGDSLIGQQIGQFAALLLGVRK